jgi:hypothetical protein
MHIEDKELEKRIEKIKNTNNSYPVCVVYDVKETVNKYILKVIFNKNFLNEKRRIKLKKNSLFKDNKLTSKLYGMFELGHRSYNLDDKERNISLFILLKKIGVVTEDNKIDSSKFKGLVLFVEDYNSKPGEIKKNPKYTVCYGYLFNRMYPLSYIEDYDFFIESYLIKGHKEWRRDYREFKKFDEQDRRIKELEKKLDRLENR